MMRSWHKIQFPSINFTKLVNRSIAWYRTTEGIKEQFIHHRTGPHGNCKDLMENSKQLQCHSNVCKQSLLAPHVHFHVIYVFKMDGYHDTSTLIHLHMFKSHPICIELGLFLNSCSWQDF